MYRWKRAGGLWREELPTEFEERHDAHRPAIPRFDIPILAILSGTIDLRRADRWIAHTVCIYDGFAGARPGTSRGRFPLHECGPGYGERVSGFHHIRLPKDWAGGRSLESVTSFPEWRRFGPGVEGAPSLGVGAWGFCIFLPHLSRAAVFHFTESISINTLPFRFRAPTAA